MFGGHGIYRDGVMFGLEAGGEIFLKGDQASEAAFRRAGARQFVYDKNGKSVAMSFWRLPDEALDDPDALARWSKLAFDTARRAKVR